MIKSTRQVEILVRLNGGYLGEYVRRLFGSPFGAILRKGDHGFPVRIRHVKKLPRAGYVIESRHGFMITQKGRAACVNHMS